MKRGRLEIAAQIILAAMTNPDRAPSRIMATTGVPYKFLSLMLNAGLIELIPMGKVKRRRKLRITQKGREFIIAYKICDSLFPETALRALQDASNDSAE